MTLLTIWCPQCHWVVCRVRPETVSTICKLECGMCNRHFDVMDVNETPGPATELPCDAASSVSRRRYRKHRYRLRGTLRKCRPGRDGVAMITTYRIEFWNPATNKYVTAWEGTDLVRAEIMYNKPYYRINTRRLIRTQSEALYSDKGKVT